MSKNLNAAPITFAIVLFSSGLATARADERMNQVQTALASTTISGYLSVEMTALQPQQVSARNGDLSFSPINPSDVEITAATITLSRFNFEPPVNLSSTIQLGQMNYDGDSSGAEMMEASRTERLIDTPVQPILPPTPDLQIQFNQAGIQPAPEPSTFALLGLGMAAIFVRRRK